MRIRLVPVEPGDPIELKKPLLIVGRQQDCDVAIPHSSVSKQHCILTLSDGTVFLRDLGSTNGTRVNGQRVRRAALLPNDRLSFASFGYRVVFGEPDVESAKTERIDVLKREALRRLERGTDRSEGPDLGGGAPEGPAVVKNDLPDVL